MSLNEFDEQMGVKPALLRNASIWMQEPLQEPDQMLTDVFDRGDKLVIIGSSKSRKTFFDLQMILSMAAGRPFLGWDIPEPRMVLHVQYEIQAHHFHRRLLRMAQAMGIEPSDLADRLQILNARGLGLTGQPAIDKIKEYTTTIKPDLVSIDPLYKILDGDENSNGKDGMKGTLAAFDGITEETGAAVSYVHHDAKGSAGDRQTTDRGAGGGILGRDYDAAIVLTPHATEEGAFVVETALRNYPPQEPFTIIWTENDATGGYCFERRDDLMPEKKTSRTRTQAPSLDTYLQTALDIIGPDECSLSVFDEQFKARTNLSDHRIRGFKDFAFAGGNPHIIVRVDTKAKNKKWLRRGKSYE